MCNSVTTHTRVIGFHASLSHSASVYGSIQRTFFAQLWKLRWLQACEHKVLAVHSGNLAGFWPIPEAFRLEPGMTVLPPRAAQPRLAFLPQVRCHVIAFSHLVPLLHP